MLSIISKNVCFFLHSMNNQGCLPGFYQPLVSSDPKAQGPAKACPDGQWCPSGFTCTIPCVYGRSENSTFAHFPSSSCFVTSGLEKSAVFNLLFAATFSHGFAQTSTGLHLWRFYFLYCSFCVQSTLGVIETQTNKTNSPGVCSYPHKVSGNVASSTIYDTARSSCTASVIETVREVFASL